MHSIAGTRNDMPWCRYAFFAYSDCWWPKRWKNIFSGVSVRLQEPPSLFGTVWSRWPTFFCMKKTQVVWQGSMSQPSIICCGGFPDFSKRWAQEETRRQWCGQASGQERLVHKFEVLADAALQLAAPWAGGRSYLCFYPVDWLSSCWISLLKILFYREKIDYLEWLPDIVSSMSQKIARKKKDTWKCPFHAGKPVYW